MTHDAHRVVIGCGPSNLGQAEARWVGAELRRTRPHVKVDYAVVSRGSERGTSARALEEALLAGTIDAAVTCARDLPLDERPGVVLGAVPTRELPFDVLVAPEGYGLEDLPRGARVGTAGVARRAQIIAQRADVTVIEIPADPQAAIERYERGEIDAIVLPGAELERLGLAGRVSEILIASVCLPGPGQGAIAIRAREKDARARDFIRLIDDPVARAAVLAERACLKAVGAGPDAPVAAYCEAMGEVLSLDGLIASPDGRRTIRDSEEGTIEDALAIGETLGRRLRAEGGESILRALPSAARG